MNPRRTVAVLFGGSVLVVTLDQLFVAGEIRPRNYLGLGGAYAFLALMADVAPQIATPLAWLVFVAIVVSRREVFERITRKVSG